MRHGRVCRQALGWSNSPTYRRGWSQSRTCWARHLSKSPKKQLHSTTSLTKSSKSTLTTCHPSTGRWHLFLSRKVLVVRPEMPRTLLLLFGKRKRRRRLLISTHVGEKIIFLHDAISGRHFLVDTGAARSVFPHRSSATAEGPRLVGADGRAIPTWNTIAIHLQFGAQKFTFPFLLAAVQHTFLGIDLFRKFKLLVNSFNYNVVDSHTGPSVTLTNERQVHSISATTTPVFPWVSKFLNSFPNTPRNPSMGSSIPLRPWADPSSDMSSDW